MFNHFNPEPVKFVSNPPLPDKPVIVPIVNDYGSPKNHVDFVPNDNHSPLEGVHFVYETMSLRAKLNLGVPLQVVSNPPMENDPLVLQNKAIHLQRSIHARLEDLRAEDAAVSSSVQPKTE